MPKASRRGTRRDVARACDPRAAGGILADLFGRSIVVPRASDVSNVVSPLPPVAAQSATEPAGLPPDAMCANCRAPMRGHFCAQCGAPRIDERPLTVRRFVNDLWNELTNVDSGT